MATEFKIRTKEKKGFTALIVRCQSKALNIDYRMSSGLNVDIHLGGQIRIGISKVLQGSGALLRLLPSLDVYI